jgi:hypothetical protein
VTYPGFTPVGNATLVVANVLTCNKHSQISFFIPQVTHRSPHPQLSHPSLPAPAHSSLPLTLPLLTTKGCYSSMLLGISVHQGMDIM